MHFNFCKLKKINQSKQKLKLLWVTPEIFANEVVWMNLEEQEAQINRSILKR